MLKLKPFIYSPSIIPHRRLSGAPIAVDFSDYIPAKSVKQSRRPLIHRSFSVQMESNAVNTPSTLPSPAIVKLKVIEATPETFKEFGQVIEATPDGEPYGPNDAQLDLSNGIPRFYIMQLKGRSLKFSSITHHANVTQCLGSIGGDVWYLGVAKPSIVGSGPSSDPVHCPDIVQAKCGHFYVPPGVDEVQGFRISGPKFIKLNVGTWHAGPLFTVEKMDFYNLELSNTNEVDHTTHYFNKKNGVTFLMED
ncbi:hypothetical protein P3S67_020359 [Capsicum chacoense]